MSYVNENTIGLKEIGAQYGFGDNFWRPCLARAEFEKHRNLRSIGFYKFFDTPELHEKIKNYLQLKTKKR